MSGIGFLVAVCALWLAIGITLSIVMGRRGHNSFGWFVLGTLMGPFATLLANVARRNDELLEPESVLKRTEQGRGPVDVLVGYDGSAESAAAVARVVSLLGDRVGRLTVATVLPYGSTSADSAPAAQALRRLVASTPAASPQLEVLHGHPATVLSEYALSGGFELIAVGTRGAGLSKAIFGSAASELARDSKVPVLLVGAGGLPADERAADVA